MAREADLLAHLRSGHSGTGSVTAIDFGLVGDIIIRTLTVPVALIGCRTAWPRSIAPMWQLRLCC